MRSLICLAAALFTLLRLHAQDDKAIQSIVEEGKVLYRTEMASWIGTDLFLERFPEKRERIGGYFSYADGEKTNCVFFDGNEQPQILAVLSFDQTFGSETADIDSLRRDFTKNERELFELRDAALKTVVEDTFFVRYNNTNLNFIPVIRNGEKKVYILTAPTVNDLLVFGNDYLLIYDENNRLISKKILHRNIIPMSFSDGDKGVSAVHSHVAETGDYITATDICTLMLYEKYTELESYMVVSEKYMSIWNCKTNTLAVVPRESFEKIQKDQEKKRRKKRKTI